MTSQGLHRAPIAANADPLAHVGVRAHFAAGEEVYAQGEKIDLIYRAISGSVRTSRLLSDGRRQIGDFYYPSDLFGLEVGSAHRFSAEALSDCEILMIRRTALTDGGEQGARMRALVSAAMAEELGRTQDHLMLLGRKTACEKVASFLLDLADRFEGEFTSMPMGRRDMADYLGLTIETVSRMVGLLQAENLVEFANSRRYRVKHRDGLAHLVVA